MEHYGRVEATLASPTVALNHMTSLSSILRISRCCENMVENLLYMTYAGQGR